MSRMADIDITVRQINQIIDEIVKHGAHIEQHKQKMQKLREDLQQLVISNYTPATVRVSELFDKGD